MLKAENECARFKICKQYAVRFGMQGIFGIWTFNTFYDFTKPVKSLVEDTVKIRLEEQRKLHEAQIEALKAEHRTAVEQLEAVDKAQVQRLKAS